MFAIKGIYTLTVFTSINEYRSCNFCIIKVLIRVLHRIIIPDAPSSSYPYEDTVEADNILAESSVELAQQNTQTLRDVAAVRGYAWKLRRGQPPKYCILWGDKSRSQTYCLMDVDAHGEILHDRFIFVTLQVSKFSDGPHFISWCSCWAGCNIDRTLRSMDFSLAFSVFFGNATNMQQCIHIHALLDTLRYSSDYQTCSNVTDIETVLLYSFTSVAFPVPLQHMSLCTPMYYNEKMRLYIIFKDHQWIPATLDERKRLRCRLCNTRSTKYCSHTNRLPCISENVSTLTLDGLTVNEGYNEDLDEDISNEQINHDDELEEGNGQIDSANSTSIARSRDPVPEEPCALLKEKMFARNTGVGSFPRQLIPTLRNCRHCSMSLAICHPLRHHSRTMDLDSSVIFHMNFPVQNIEVFYFQCPNCSQKEYYQGNEDGLFNLDDTHLYSYEIIYSFLNEQMNVAMSFFSFWKNRLDSYAMLGVDAGKIARWANLRNEFQRAVLQFIMLMHIPYEQSFDCPCHGQISIVVDGFNMSIRADRIEAFDDLAWCASPDSLVKVGSSYSDREIFTSRPRELLFRLCDHRSVKSSGLSPEEYNDMCALLLENASSRAFLPLFGHFQPVAVEKPIPGKAPTLLYSDRHIQPFLRTISARVSPVCKVVHPSLIDIIERLVSNGCLSMQDNAQLGREAPVFHAFCTKVLEKMPDHKWPTDLISMLEVLIRKSCAPFSENYGMQHDDPAALVPPYKNYDAEMLKTGYCYPAKPAIRRLRKYAKDNESKKGKYGKECKRGCTKHSKKSGSTGPGSFFVYCGMHKTCLGFHLLRNHESPRTIFELLYTRWEVPPELLVYDNACNAFEYMLNREPDFVRNMKTASDGMHYNNHENCSEVFDFRQYATAYKEVVSVLAEIINSRLRNLKIHAMYMTSANFMVLTRYFLHRLNKKFAEKNLSLKERHINNDNTPLNL